MAGLICLRREQTEHADSTGLVKGSHQKPSSPGKQNFGSQHCSLSISVDYYGCQVSQACNLEDYPSPSMQPNFVPVE